MRHYLLTRAVYDPALWPIEEAERRLELFAGVTVPSLAHQTERRLTWTILVHRADPLMGERLRAAHKAGYPVRVIFTDASHSSRARAAAMAYREKSWVVTPEDDYILTTRLDDDDAFAPQALATVRGAVRYSERRAFIIPRGYRVWQGEYQRVVHLTNAWASLLSPPGDAMTVYSYGHRKVEEVAPVEYVDDIRGWLWVRHPDTLTDHYRLARAPIDDKLRSKFPGVRFELLG